MPEVRIGAGWSDRRWKEALQKLTSSQKLVIENSLRGLLAALLECRDPLLDSALQAWNPSRWAVPYKRDAYGTWIEFRLGDDDNRARAIVCYDRKAGVIYLVARTAIHDHRALNELVTSFSPPRKPPRG